MIILDEGRTDYVESGDDVILPTLIVMKRAAEELDRISELCSELESHLLPIMQNTLNDDIHKPIQSIDLMQQTVIALSGFLHRSSNDAPECKIDITESLSKITLKDVRSRLSRTYDG